MFNSSEVGATKERSNKATLMIWNHQNVSGWWLGHPSEKYERQLGWLFPIYRKIKMFQTTNQFFFSIVSFQLGICTPQYFVDTDSSNAQIDWTLETIGNLDIWSEYIIEHPGFTGGLLFKPLPFIIIPLRKNSLGESGRICRNCHGQNPTFSVDHMPRIAKLYLMPSITWFLESSGHRDGHPPSHRDKAFGCQQ